MGLEKDGFFTNRFLCYHEFMKPIDYTSIFKKYAGKWIALKGDEKTVVSSSQTAKKALESAISAGVKKPILFKVPSQALPYVGSGYL